MELLSHCEKNNNLRSSSEFFSTNAIFNDPQVFSKRKSIEHNDEEEEPNPSKSLNKLFISSFEQDYNDRSISEMFYTDTFEEIESD
jgi:hypothetical protein